MVDDPLSQVDPKEVWERLRKTAVFAKSVLHLPFEHLELVNPSFSVMSKYCDLLAALLREQKTDKEKHESAADLACILRDIATAIVDRDDKSMIDAMCILDQFLDDTRLFVVKAG